MAWTYDKDGNKIHKYRVHFWNGAKGEYTPDAIFDTVESAEEYANSKFPRFQKFVSHAVIQMDESENVKRVDRLNTNPILKPLARAIWSVGGDEEVLRLRDEERRLAKELNTARVDLRVVKVGAKKSYPASDLKGLSASEKKQALAEYSQQNEAELYNQEEVVEELRDQLEEIRTMIDERNQMVPKYARRNPVANFEDLNQPGVVQEKSFEPLVINTDNQEVADAAWYYQRGNMRSPIYNPMSPGAEKWRKHLMAYHKAHPGNSFSKSMKEAAKVYKRNPDNGANYEFSASGNIGTKFGFGLPTVIISSIAALGALWFFQRTKDTSGFGVSSVPGSGLWQRQQ